MRRRKLRLGIDLDGVVADFNRGWIELYNAEFGADLAPEQVVSWGGPAELTHFGSMREFWRWARRADGGSSIFRHLPLYPDARESLSRLAADHEIVVLTAKPWYAVHDTYAWISDQELPTTEVHIVSDKSSVPCDVYIDDADHNLRELVDRRPDSVVCRFERPWNQPLAGVVDIDEWDAFEAVVAHLAGSI